jgi:oligosaccharide repeat unit polymerase
MIFLFEIVLGLICLACVLTGFRVGVISCLGMFGIHVFLGFVARSGVLDAGWVTQDSFYMVLMSKQDADISHGLILVSIAVFMTFIGYLLTGGERFTRMVKGWARQVLPSDSNSNYIIALCVFAVFWLVFLLGLIDYYGSISDAFLNFRKRAITFTTKINLLRSLLMGAYACLVFATNYFAKRKVRKDVFKLEALFFGLCVVFHLYGIFMTGGRGFALTQLFTLVFVYNHAKGGRILRFSFKSLVASFAAAIIVVIVVVGGYAMRMAAQQDISAQASLGNVSGEVVEVLSSTFPLIDLFVASSVYSAEGLTYGENYVNIALRFIPRDLWPDKPRTLGLQMRQFFYGDTLSAVPPTVYGELYLAAGLLGLIFGGYLFGVLIKSIDILFVSELEGFSVSIISYFLSFQIAFGILKSGFENSLLHVVYYVFALLAIKYGLVFLKPLTHRNH